MKPPENIEKMIKNIDIDTNAESDKAVLDDVLKEFEKSRQKLSTLPESNLSRIITRTRLIKTTAIAASFIVVFGLFVLYRNNQQQPDTAAVAQPATSPAKMLTLGSTTMAYRRGGMDAVEKQIKKAFTMLGPRTTSIPFEDLI